MLFETIPISFITLVVGTLGLPGLITVFWYFDHRRYEARDIQYKEDLNRVLLQYKENMDRMEQMYRDNVILAKDNQKLGERFEKMNSEVISVVSYNSQTMSSLAELVRDIKEEFRRERYGS